MNVSFQVSHHQAPHGSHLLVTVCCCHKKHGNCNQINCWFHQDALVWGISFQWLSSHTTKNENVSSHNCHASTSWVMWPNCECVTTTQRKWTQPNREKVKKWREEKIFLSIFCICKSWHIFIGYFSSGSSRLVLKQFFPLLCTRENMTWIEIHTCKLVHFGLH